MVQTCVMVLLVSQGSQPSYLALSTFVLVCCYCGGLEEEDEEGDRNVTIMGQCNAMVLVPEGGSGTNEKGRRGRRRKEKRNRLGGGREHFMMDYDYWLYQCTLRFKPLDSKMCGTPYKESCTEPFSLNLNIKLFEIECIVIN